MNSQNIRAGGDPQRPPAIVFSFYSRGEPKQGFEEVKGLAQSHITVSGRARLELVACAAEYGGLVKSGDGEVHTPGFES